MGRGYLSYGFCILSSIGICDGPIPPPEKSYRMCAIECNQVQQILLYTYIEQVEEIRLGKGESKKEFSEFFGKQRANWLSDYLSAFSLVGNELVN